MRHPNFSLAWASPLMDLNQFPSLSNEQLIAWALAIICELSRRCGVQFQVAADIGTPSGPPGDDTGPLDTATSSAGGDPPTSANATEVPAPSTPTAPREGCCYLCNVRDCQNFCSASGPHQQHVCDYHSWY